MSAVYKELIVSPSRIKDAMRCMRYWAFHKLGRLPRQETQPLRDGKAAHAVQEAYLKHGTPHDITTKYGRWCVEGVHLLPKPHTALVEHRVHRFVWEGLPWTVVFDCVHIGSQTKLDHKFVSANGARFALNPITLVEDCQALLNTIAPPQFPTTRLRWVYYVKGGSRKPWAVDAQITPQQAENTFRRKYLPLVKDMHTYHALFAGVHPDDAVELCNALPCSTENCMAYGTPCEYMGVCRH